MTKDYECLFILRSDLADDAIAQETKKAKEYIESEGGSITDESAWGKKRLAHTIRKQRYGFYVLFRFSVNGGAIKTIERKFLLDENVLKAMTIVVDSSIAGKPLPGGIESADHDRKPATEKKDSASTTDEKKDSASTTDEKKDSASATDEKKDSEPATDEKKDSELATDEKKDSEPATDEKKDSEPATDEKIAEPSAEPVADVEP